MGYSQEASSELGLIPTHSHFFGAWVEAGICGALFWGFALSLIARILIMKHKKRNDFIPLIIFVVFHLSWDIFFSPFGADQRFTTPFYLIAMITYLPGKKIKIVRQETFRNRQLI